MSIVKHLIYLLGVIGIGYMTIVYPIMAICRSLDNSTFTFTLLGRCIILILVSRLSIKVWTMLMIGDSDGQSK